MRKKNNAQRVVLPASHPPKPKQAAKRQIRATPTPSEPVLPPITITLGATVTRLVRWYCQITHQQEADAIEGALTGVLERAWAAYQEEIGIDEAFNWLLDDVSMFLQSDARESRLPWRGGTSLQLSPEASLLLHERLRAHGHEDPRDVVSGAVVVLLGSRQAGASRSLEDCIRSTRAGREAKAASSEIAPV